MLNLNAVTLVLVTSVSFILYWKNHVPWSVLVKFLNQIIWLLMQLAHIVFVWFLQLPPGPMLHSVGGFGVPSSMYSVTFKRLSGSPLLAFTVKFQFNLPQPALAGTTSGANNFFFGKRKNTPGSPVRVVRFV